MTDVFIGTTGGWWCGCTAVPSSSFSSSSSWGSTCTAGAHQGSTMSSSLSWIQGSRLFTFQRPFLKVLALIQYGTGREGGSRMRIRILGSVPLTDGSGCGYVRPKILRTWIRMLMRMRNNGIFTSFFKDKKSERIY
jgi:hypothetical protein